MIGSVHGRIASKTPPQLTVEVGGLGYELEAPMSTFFLLPAVGAEVRLLRWEQRAGWLAVVPLRHPPPSRRGQPVETGTVAHTYPFSAGTPGDRV